MYSTDSTTSSNSAIHHGPSKAHPSIKHHLKRGFIAFGTENFGKIVNISQTGITIEFMVHKNRDNDNFSQISIINNLEGYLLDQLNCSTINTSDTPISSTDNLTVLRRMEMVFTAMNESQQSQLNTLLEHYSEGEYSPVSKLQ